MLTSTTFVLRLAFKLNVVVVTYTRVRAVTQASTVLALIHRTLVLMLTVLGLRLAIKLAPCSIHTLVTMLTTLGL